MPRIVKTAPNPAVHCGSEVGIPALGLSPPFFGDARSAVERLLEGHRSEALQQGVVAGDGAGHGRGVDPVGRHRLRPEFASEKFGCPSGRRPTAGVQRVELLVLGDVHEGEKVASDAGVVLRGHVEHRTGGDGGVDGVAALPQNLEAGLRCQRIAGRDDAVPGEHLGSTLREPTLRARTRYSRHAGVGLRLVDRWSPERVLRLRERHAHREGDRQDRAEDADARANTGT